VANFLLIDQPIGHIKNKCCHRRRWNVGYIRGDQQQDKQQENARENGGKRRARTGFLVDTRAGERT